MKKLILSTAAVLALSIGAAYAQEAESQDKSDSDTTTTTQPNAACIQGSSNCVNQNKTNNLEDLPTGSGDDTTETPGDTETPEDEESGNAPSDENFPDGGGASTNGSTN